MENVENREQKAKMKFASAKKEFASEKKGYLVVERQPNEIGRAHV